MLLVFEAVVNLVEKGGVGWGDAGRHGLNGLVVRWCLGEGNI